MNTRLRSLALVAALGAAALLGACAHKPGPSATAILLPTTGNAAHGVVTFQMVDDRVLVKGKVRGLKPNQDHGFHAHEKGDCSSGDGLSTGGHFNPTGKPHGSPLGEHHAGDIPAITADASGVAEFEFLLSDVTIGSGPTDLVGRGLIVHASQDDYATQPTGNSGARIACGGIKRDPTPGN